MPPKSEMDRLWQAIDKLEARQALLERTLAERLERMEEEMEERIVKVEQAILRWTVRATTLISIITAIFGVLQAYATWKSLTK